MLRPLMWAKWELDGLSGSSVPVFPSRFALLEHALKLVQPDGLRLEFGVYQGESVNHLASVDGMRWFGFDSFEGLPSRWELSFTKGKFTTHGALPPVRNNVTLVKGWYSDTIPDFVRSMGQIHVAFLHIDCDLYQSARTVLSALGDGISAGTIIVFDEYAGITPDDEARAFREWRALSGHECEFVGCSAYGSVAIRILGDILESSL